MFVSLLLGDLVGERVSDDGEEEKRFNKDRCNFRLMVVGVVVVGVVFGVVVLLFFVGVVGLEQERRTHV